MKFSYRAFDKSGKAVADVMEAIGQAEASEALRRDGLFVTEINAISEQANRRVTRKKCRVGKGKRLRLLAMFARQLHVLVASGTPLVQALGAIERQADNDGWRAVVGGLRDKVEQGVPLSEAMEAQSQFFDPVCRSLAAAGESSGNMPEMLDRLSSLTRKQLHLRSSIIGAMVYPGVLCTVGVAVVNLMLLFVLPRFAGMFKTLDVPLPPPTRFMMALSDGLQSYWWAVLLGLAAFIFCLRAWLRSNGGRRTVQDLLLRAPRLGRIAQSLITARLSRMLGVLMESHVPLLDALRLTRQATSNYRYADLLTRAEDAVSRGEPISAAFADTKLITPSIHEAIRSGEQSGRVGSLLLQISDFLDEENEVVVRSLTSIIEPLILVALGVLVAFIAMSMFLPLFDLTAMTQGAGG